MSPELAYLLKVNIALALFYAFYRLFFYKDTFFKLRRTVLLVCFALAIVYPLLNIQEWMKEQETINEVIIIYSAIMPSGAEVPDAVSPQFPLALIAEYFYIAIAALLLMHCIIQLLRISHLALKSKRITIEGAKVYALSKPSGPFSFFRMIFISPGIHSPQEINEILTHERAHASQWHSVDVMLSEALCIFCWMNPFAWLLRREVRHNLEYLADNAVLKSGVDGKIYQYHLLGLTNLNQATANIYNNFNVSHLKNRISMMNQKRSRAIWRTKYLIFLPLAAMLMLLNNVEAVARMAQKFIDKPEAVEQPSAPQDKQKTVFSVVEEMPIYPGGNGELLKFLTQNIKYPPEAVAKKLEGRVIVVFIVNEDGSVSDVDIARSVDPLLDAEAMRVVNSMPIWTPGKQKGINVAVKYTVPVTFNLGKEKDALTDDDNTALNMKHPVYDIRLVGRLPHEDNPSQSDSVWWVIKTNTDKEAGMPWETGGQMIVAHNRLRAAKDKKVAGGDKVVKKDAEYDPIVVPDIVQEAPKFPGGDKELLNFLRTNTNYPQQAQIDGVKGRVMCSFVVEKDGSITNAQIAQSVDPLLDAEALRVVRLMPNWTPGKQRGVNVAVKYVVPVSFGL